MIKCYLRKMLCIICLIGPSLSISNVNNIDVKEAYLQTPDGAMTSVLPQVHDIVGKKTILSNMGNYICHINMVELISEAPSLSLKISRRMVTPDEVNLILVFRCQEDQEFVKAEIKSIGDFDVGIACSLGNWPTYWRGRKISVSTINKPNGWMSYLYNLIPTH